MSAEGEVQFNATYLKRTDVRLQSEHMTQEEMHVGLAALDTAATGKKKRRSRGRPKTTGVLQLENQPPASVALQTGCTTCKKTLRGKDYVRGTHYKNCADGTMLCGTCSRGAKCSKHPELWSKGKNGQ